MAQIITAEDVASYTSGLSKADIATLINGVNAKAARVAPCLAGTPDEDQLAEAKLILVGAVKRWSEAGSGAFSQQTIGPASVSVDTRQRSGGYNLWPSEIDDLQAICSDSAEPTRAFSFRPTGTGTGPQHWPWCDWPMYGLPCSCGASLTGAEPLYEA